MLFAGEAFSGNRSYAFPKNVQFIEQCYYMVLTQFTLNARNSLHKNYSAFYDFVKFLVLSANCFRLVR